MSAIVKYPDGKIVLFCKGADSVIYERLEDERPELQDFTSRHMDAFAQDGLRTLCLATATLSNYEYQEWDLEFQAASVCLEDREQRMDDVAEKIEQKLSLLGATAIEDKLQESVPEAIHTLSAAGIKIWVLTGDKVETAVNIGFSCNLLKKEMSLLLIKPPINISGSPLSDFKSTRQQMEDSLEIFWGLRLKYTDGGIPDVESINPAVPHTVSSPKVALIIDGMALKDALEKKENSHVFWLLATRCAVVLCCRVSPLQKAKVVELVKLTGKGALCLAIGDGANDVGMIQAAQIGVGIAGEEGLQAVMASDYAIAQFKYLCRLMLVHGRWSYVRTSEMILNFFFKNLIYVLPLFWYQYLCAFSSQQVFAFSYMLLYNLVFSSSPVIVLGIFDRDVSDKLAVLIPPLYHQGIKNEAFTTRLFVLYLIDGIYQSLVCFFITLGVYQEMPVDGTGRAATSTELGTIMAINAIFNANLFVAVNTNSRTWLSFLAVGGSNLMVIAWTVIFSLSSTSFLTSVDSILVGIGPDIWRYPTFYLTIVLVSVGCHLPRLTILYLRRQLYPTDIMLVQEMENRGIHKIHEEQLAKEEQAATLKRQSMAVATPSPLHHLHSIKKPQDSFAVVETIPEEQIQPISCETPSPEYDSTLNAESVLVDIQPVVSTSIAPIATISEGFQQQTLPISTHLEIEIPSNQAIQYQVNQEETQYQEKQQFDQDQPQQSFDQQQQQQLPSQPQHHVSFYVEPSSSVSPYQSTTITVTSPSPPPPPTLPLLIDSTSIAAAAVLTSSIDAEELTSVLQWASPTMSSSPPLSNSNSEYDGMHGINLTLMNNGMLYETRGFSFSESPGARDVIMGRTDIRHQSIVRRQSIMRKFSSTSLRNNSDAKSTRTVPNLRPRANTFTYGKRFGSLTDIAKSK